MNSLLPIPDLTFFFVKTSFEGKIKRRRKFSINNVDIKSKSVKNQEGICKFNFDARALGSTFSLSRNTLCKTNLMDPERLFENNTVKAKEVAPF